MKKLEIKNFKGKEICYLDFSGLKEPSDIIALIEEGKEYIRKRPEKSVYSLTNIENMHFNNDVKELFSDFVKGNKTYIKASAVIGVSGLRQFMFNGLMKITGRDIRSFDSTESAVNWLSDH